MGWPTLLEIRRMSTDERINYIEARLRATGRPGMENIINLLHNGSDFYSAPASTTYHSDFTGGLLEHSLCVHSAAMRLRDTLVEMNPELGPLLDPASVEICALLHDICKINVYRQTVKNVKGSDGSWEQKLVYEFNDTFPMGHGEKSIAILLYYGLSLTVEEMLAIRHHMGIQDALSGNCMKALNSASSMTPLVSLIQSADCMSSRMMEKVE